MRQLIFILLSILTVNGVAQISPSNIYELKRYYKDHISTLDPIEGIYDGIGYQWLSNAYRDFPKEKVEFDPVMIYKDPSGVFKWFGNPQVTITKLNGNIYNYNVFWQGSNVTDVNRIALRNGITFEVTSSIPEKQLRYDIGNKLRPGDGVHFHNSFIKTYPTDEMYAEAIRKKIQEEESLPSNWSGTGFAIAQGYIVTSYHVVENASQIKVYGIKGNFDTGFSVQIIGTDKNNDLALLKIQNPDFSDFGKIPYNITYESAEVGEDIYVLGYPLISTMGDEIKLTTGVISSKTGYQGDISSYQISAPIQPGNSGGPLFDKKGNVIGVVSSKHIGAENVGYAIKTSCLKNLIDIYITPSTLRFNNTVSTLSLAEKVKAEKNFIYYIECAK